MSVALFLLPEAKVEGNKNDITWVQGFNRLLFQCTIYDWLPVIKPSASATIHDVIGGSFCKIDLDLSCNSLDVVVYCYDGFQRYPNSSHFCLGMIFDCFGIGKQKHFRAATIKEVCLASGKNAKLLCLWFNKVYVTGFMKKGLIYTIIKEI